MACALPSGSLASMSLNSTRMPRLFGQHANLRADVAVADDAQRLAAHLITNRPRS